MVSRSEDPDQKEGISGRQVPKGLGRFPRARQVPKGLTTL